MGMFGAMAPSDRVGPLHLPLMSAETPRPQAAGTPPIRLDAGIDGPLGSLDAPVLVGGDAAAGLSLLPALSVQTVVTSPPYWSLRDYATAEQIGCDDGLAEYIKSIVVTFDALRRVLAEDGTVWLNVGDGYTSGNRRYRARAGSPGAVDFCAVAVDFV